VTQFLVTRLGDGPILPKDLSKNNISIMKCFSVYWSQWLTPLQSRHATRL